MTKKVNNVTNTIRKKLVRTAPETLLLVRNIAQVRAIDVMMAEAKRVKILITE